MIMSLRKRAVAIFVEKSSQQWVVRDPEGTFWIVPTSDDPWNDRQPFEPTEEHEFEPVPAHYKFLLGLPF